MNIKIDLTNIELNTKRIKLRLFKESDLNDFYEYASVNGVGEMAGWKHHETIDDTRKVLDIFINKKEVFALEYKENQRVIGSLGIHDIDFLISSLDKYKGKEIGYVLSKDYWGNEIMKEAVLKVIDYLFNEVKLDYLVIGHFNTNNQSKRVIEKCGFIRFSTGEMHSKQLDKTFSTINYIIKNPKSDIDIKEICNESN